MSSTFLISLPDEHKYVSLSLIEQGKKNTGFRNMTFIQQNLYTLVTILALNIIIWKVLFGVINYYTITK